MTTALPAFSSSSALSSELLRWVSTIINSEEERIIWAACSGVFIVSL